MSASQTGGDLARDVAALIRALEDLQAELEPGNRRRMGLPTPRDLLRLTSEVTIPAAILVLETNVRVLRLIQRSIRATTEDGTGEATGGAARQRAEALGRQTLRGLDDALAEIESAIDDRPGEEPAASLVEEARRLRASVDAELADGPGTGESRTGLDDLDRDPVEVDVEAELQSIRDEIDDADGGDAGDDGKPGDA